MQNEEEIITTDNNHKAAKKKVAVFSVLVSIFCVILTVISLCFISFNVVFDSNEISGESMQPTYNYPNGNSKDVAYYSSFFTPTRGDVIVVKQIGYSIIKRLIALEGDTVCVKKEADGYYHIFVNDILQDESYLLDLSQNNELYSTILNSHENNWSTNIEVVVSGDSLSFEVPQNYCFYLGDNRLNSADCADYGPMHKENITDKVIFVVPDGTSFIAYWWKKIFN